VCLVSPAGAGCKWTRDGVGQQLRNGEKEDMKKNGQAWWRVVGKCREGKGLVQGDGRGV
jgi:hypothetical protein